jgi:hypothetical protein
MIVRCRPIRGGLASALSILVLAAACGGDSGNGSDQPPASGDVIQLRGGERLAWEQSAPSFAALTISYTFTLFTDNQPSALPGVDCIPSPTANGFPCSAPIPRLNAGRHSLSVAANVGRDQSPRSPELLVQVSSGSSTEAMSGARPPAAPTIRACTGETGHDCYRSRRLVALEAPLSSPVTLDPSRTMFVESGRVVRILADGLLVRDPALILAPNQQVLEVAVDPAFAQTRLVYMALVETAADEAKSVLIARFREVQNRLGEQAVISTIPLAPGEDPRATFDADNQVYVAVGGTLHRLTSDGLTPSTQRRPELFESAMVVTALAFDRFERRILMSAEQPTGESRIGELALDTSRLAFPEGHFSPDLSTRGIVGLAVAGASERRTWFAVTVDGLLFLGPVGDLTRSTRVLPLGQELAVDVSDAGNDVYVTTRRAGQNGPVYSIYRLTADQANHTIKSK